MKRIISMLLAVIIMISMTTPSFAANTDEDFYTVQVEYSDNIGHQEELNIMIKNNNVFADAKMLAERLGYTFVENGENVVIYNKETSNGLPFGITQFKYNSTQVYHMLFNNMIDTYEAPFASVKNSEGSWIPLEYSLLLINSGMMITDEALLIDIPMKKIIDYFYDITKKSEKYSFDWADDYGYTETEFNMLGGSSHLINVFNGLLGFDGASCATLLQQFAGSMSSYDKKYGENLAMLLCTESDKELQATIDKIDMLIEVLDEDGNLGKMLSSTSTMLDSQVSTLYKNCEDILKKVKSGNSPLVSYNRSYQALEEALDRQTWFSNTGGNILEVQKAAGEAVSFLKVATKVLEVVGYAQEFQNQDKFSLDALTYYLGNKHDGLELPEKMKNSMIDYSDALSSSIGEYTSKRFFENVNKWILDEIPLGTQVAAMLFAWNIASNTIPFISNGLSAADSFELALYSLVFQGDTFLNFLSKRDSAFSDAGKITAENMYDFAQYCYVYLKSCYITREAALASLENKRKSTKEKIKPLIDYQNSINAEIAKVMVKLKEARKTNEGCVFGFLLSDNEEYLRKYDDSQLISWIKESEKSELTGVDRSELYYQFIRDELIPKYGLAPLGTITGKMEKPNDNWLEYTGIVSALIEDLDQDKVQDLLLTYFSENDHPYNEEPAKAYDLHVAVYTLQNSKPVKMDDIVLFSYDETENNPPIQLLSNQFTTKKIRASLIDNKGVKQMFLEYDDYSEVFADGGYCSYWTMQYSDEKLNMVASFSQDGEGSSGFSYTGYEFEDGELQSKQLLYDENYENGKYNDFDTALTGYWSAHGIEVVTTGNQYENNESILGNKTQNTQIMSFENNVVNTRRRTYSSGITETVWYDFAFSVIDATDLRSCLEITKKRDERNTEGNEEELYGAFMENIWSEWHDDMVLRNIDYYWWAIMDLNGDGVRELIIDESPEEDWITAVYSIENDKVVNVFRRSRHGQYTIGTDGYISYFYKGAYVYKLVGTELVDLFCIDNYWELVKQWRDESSSEDKFWNYFCEKRTEHEISNAIMKFDYSIGTTDPLFVSESEYYDYRQALFVNDTIVKGLSLRTEPSTLASTIKKIPEGELVTFLEESINGFVKIQYQGNVGYVLAHYLRDS